MFLSSLLVTLLIHFSLLAFPMTRFVRYSYRVGIFELLVRAEWCFGSYPVAGLSVAFASNHQTDFQWTGCFCRRQLKVVQLVSVAFS